MDGVQQPPPSTLSQEPQPQQNSYLYSKKNWIKWVLIYAVIAAVLYGGVYYFFLAKKTTNPYTTVTPTSQPATDETANWKTYTNNEHGYSIKYPSEQLVHFNCPNEELVLLKRTPANEAEDEKIFETCARDGRFDIEVQTYTTPLPELVSDEYYAVIKEKTTIANLQADKYTSTPSANCFGICSPEWREEIRVSKNGKVYTFHTWKKELSPLFHQILSTFKFTDQADETANWKTYTSQKYGYQISHPNLTEDKCNGGSLSSSDIVDKLLIKGEIKPGTELCGDYYIAIVIDGENKTGFTKVNDYISYREKSYGENSDNFETSTVNLDGSSMTISTGIEAVKLTIKNDPDSPIYFFSDPSGKLLYYISVKSFTGSHSEEINKILSTFKFTQ